MPILDLVNRYRFGDGLPRFAIIRKGAPKPNDKQPGADLPHFRVVMQPGFENRQSTVELLFGAQPTMFSPVRFLGMNMDDVFSFWMEEHRASKMLHRCDGEQQVEWLDESTGEFCRGSLACQRDGKPPCACKPSAALNFSLPDLNREIGLPGYVTLLTTSWADVRSIMSCFKDIQTMGFNDLRRVEFTIGRESKAINTPVPQPTTPAQIEKFRKAYGRDWKPGEKAKRSKSLIYIRVTEQFSRDFMLLPSLSTPQLPEPGQGIIAPRPQIESVTGRKIVTDNSPQEQRRIGEQKSEPPPPPEITEGDWEEDEEGDDEEITETLPPAWVDEAERWAGFLKRANDRFSFTEQTVTEVLESFEAFALGDWRRDQGWALAALVAEFCQNNARRIDEYTSSMAGVKEAVALELCEHARQIATAHLNAEFEQI